MSNKKNEIIHNIQTDWEENADGLLQKSTQVIPQQFLDSLAEHRNATSGRRAGEYMRVASIPTVVVEKWMREGFNIFDKNVDGREIVKRLKNENLDAFLTTEKSI